MNIIKLKISIVCIFILVFLFITKSNIPFSVSAATTKYGILLGDEYNNYKLYSNLTILSPNKCIMVRAHDICNKLGLSYNYDKSSKKITIKNEFNGKSLEYIIDNTKYIYYSGNNTKGINKSAKYKTYFDEKNQCYFIHYETLVDIVYYKYFNISSKYKYYYDLGYFGVAVYSKYNHKDKLDLPSDEYSIKDKKKPQPTSLKALKESDPVEIEDPVLRDFICSRLDINKKIITYGDMLKLESLYIPIDNQNNIKSLKGLEYAKNITSINIEVSHDSKENKYELDYYDLWTISNLKNLKSITIDGIMLYDLDFIKNITNLTYLDISNSLYQIQNTFEYEYYNLDISSISNLSELKFLSFYATRIDDLKPINKLSNLKKFLYSGDYFESAKWTFDVSFLKSSNMKLEIVGFSSINIVNLQFLKELKELKALGLSYSKISSIGCLVDMKNLKYLKMEGMKLSNSSKEIMRKVNEFAYLDLDEDNKPQMLIINSKDMPIIEITPQIEERLESYPYFRDISLDYYYEWPPVKYDFKDIRVIRPELSKWIYDSISEFIILEDNEKLIISENLTYVADDYYAIRGVLQMDNHDGTIDEKDIEIIFKYMGTYYFAPENVDPFDEYIDDYSNLHFSDIHLRYLSFQTIKKQKE